MKKIGNGLIGIVFLSLIIVSCSIFRHSMDEDAIALQTEDMAGMVETAVQETVAFKTSVSERLTSEAPTLTPSFTPSPTITETPTPSLTPTPTITVLRDPWTLQDICLTDPSVCVKHTVNNRKLNIWVYVVLTYQETEESINFNVAPHSMNTVTLLPGIYKTSYSGDCPGVMPPSNIVRIEKLTGGDISFRCSGGSFVR